MALVRDRIMQSKIYKTILWVTLFSMAGGSLLFTPNLFRSMRSADISAIVTVNGHPITAKNLEQKTVLEFERIALLRQQLGQYAEAFLQTMGMDNPQAMALQNLITQVLLDSVADTLSLRVSPDYIAEKLKNPEFVVKELRDIIPIQVLAQDGSLNVAYLKYYLQKQHLSLADFEKSVEQALKRKIITDIVKSSSYVSQAEIDSYIIASFAKKTYSLAKISLKDMIKIEQEKEISDQELEAYFTQENKRNKRYWIPEKRTAEIFTFAPANYGIEADANDIESYYTKNKQKFILHPAQVQVRRILFKVEDKAELNKRYQLAQSVREEILADPSRFAQRAQEVSQDPQTASKGGLTEFFTRGQNDPAFDRAAFRLETDGQISDIVTTQEGLEILQRVARKKPDYKSLSSVKKEIESLLLAQKFAELFSKDMKNKLDQTYNKQSFESFAEKKRATQKKLSDQSKNENASQLVQKIFKTKTNTPSYFIDKDGNGVVVVLTAKEKSYEPTFDQVKEAVKNDLYRKKGDMLLDNALENLKKNAQKNGFKQAVSQTKAFSETFGSISAEDNEELEKLSKKGIPVNKMLSMTTPGSMIFFKDAKNGYILHLDNVEALNSEVVNQKRPEAIKNLQQEKEMLVYRGYVASLFRNATIKSVRENQANDEQLPLEELPQ